MTTAVLQRSVAASLRRSTCRRCHPGKRRHYHGTAVACSGGTDRHDNDDDPLTNGGTVVGAFIFHRHGDRAPNRYLGHPDRLRNESDHWYTRIPGGEAHDELSRYFPPEIHHTQNGGKYMDVSREPFGFLTYRGMDQMRDVGRRFRQRYERYGHRVGGGDEGCSFLDHWDVQAYSTNYLRTVMSVQCFLDGLIGKCPTNNASNSQDRIHAGGGLDRYYKDIGRYERMTHLDMSSWTKDDDMMRRSFGGGSTPGDHQIKVQVRDKEIDTLNAFDRHPQMMNGLVKDVIATEQFQRIDGKAKPLADELASYLPGLRGAPQAFGGTPSGINWIHANDHFVCRRAHSIPLAADFSETKEEIEEDVEKKLASLAVPVCSHLAWRFREWYRNPKLLSAVAGPPFNEVLHKMLETVNDLGPSDRRPFVLYSCHDVTLLALLYAIGADFLVSGEDCGGVNMHQEEGRGEDTYSGMTAGSVSKGKSRTSWRWWPAYSSTVAFELVRLNHCQSHEVNEQQHVVRVILNGRTVGLMPRMSTGDEGLLKEQTACSRQVFGQTTSNGKDNNMMRLSDFEQVISVLEDDAGNISYLEEDNLIGRIGVEGG